MDTTEPNQVPPSALRSRSPLGVGVVVVLLLGAAAGLGYLVFQRLQPVPAPVVEQAPPPVAAPAAPLVDANEGDALVAKEAATLSKDGQVVDWLSQPGMLRRLVAAVWQVSEGESPREPLRFLAPKSEFSVTSREGHTYLSDESAARYDFVANGLASVDAQRAGTLVNQVEKFANAAFKEVSPPGRRFDEALSRAIERLAATPLPEGPIELVQVKKGVGYEFADPELERLDPAQKHLLRMGARNAKIVVNQLRAFAAAANGP